MFQGRNPLFSSCGNQIIQIELFKSMQVFQTNNNTGYGLQVLEYVPKDSFLVEYTGEVITSSECYSRLSNYTIDDNMYFASLAPGQILDAKRMGSLARFANHSCDPNCVLQRWIVLGENRLVLVSLIDLQPNDELAYNYEYCNDNLDSVMKIQRQTCHCQAVNCCGTIGGRIPMIVKSSMELRRERTQKCLSSTTKRYSYTVLEQHLQRLYDLTSPNQLA